MKSKKTVMKLVLFMAVLSLFAAGCGSAQETESAEDLKQAGLGGLVMLYDDTVWKYEEENSTENSLTFMKGDDSLIGVSCSKENLYQHPLTMIEMVRQIYSTFEGYKELEPPKEVEVSGEKWYEWSYCFNEDGAENYVTQRFYGKNYYAYTISYRATSDTYEKDKKPALQVLNSVVLTVPDNTEAEESAKEFLVGEWDMDAAGYLVLNKDGTYIWYMQSSQDENNMHKGTYGCDTQNEELGFSEGEGIYLVLLPEALYTNGTEGTTGSAKYDYGVSLKQQTDGTYQMINVNTMNMYSLKKQG